MANSHEDFVLAQRQARRIKEVTQVLNQLVLEAVKDGLIVELRTNDFNDAGSNWFRLNIEVKINL